MPKTILIRKMDFFLKFFNISFLEGRKNWAQISAIIRKSPRRPPKIAETKFLLLFLSYEPDYVDTIYNYPVQGIRTQIVKNDSSAQ